MPRSSWSISAVCPPDPRTYIDVSASARRLRSAQPAHAREKSVPATTRNAAARLLIRLFSVSQRKKLTCACNNNDPVRYGTVVLIG